MASGCGQESPSPGGAHSQGKGRKINTGLRGLDPRTGFPLNCRTPPLLGASGHYTVHHAQTHRHLLSPRSRSSTFHPPGAPVLPDSFSCSLAERHTTAGVVVSLVVGVAFSAAAFRLRQLLSAPPVLRVSTARPRFPRARTAALDRVASPPRGVEPALPGRRVAPAPAASLSSLARPPPSAGSSSGPGRRGPPCRRSRWSGCHCDARLHSQTI